MRFFSLFPGESSIPYLPVNCADTGIHPSGSGFKNIIHSFGSKAAPGVEDGLYPRGFQSWTITTCRETGSEENNENKDTSGECVPLIKFPSPACLRVLVLRVPLSFFSLFLPCFPPRVRHLPFDFLATSNLLSRSSFCLDRLVFLVVARLGRFWNDGVGRDKVYRIVRSIDPVSSFFEKRALKHSWTRGVPKRRSVLIFQHKQFYNCRKYNAEF